MLGQNLHATDEGYDPVAAYERMQKTDETLKDINRKASRNPSYKNKKKGFRSCSLGCCGQFILFSAFIVIMCVFREMQLLGTYIIKAQYAVEGVPVIGNIRTKIEHFRVEHNYLPGVAYDYEAKSIVTNGLGYGTSALLDSGVIGTKDWQGVQSMCVSSNDSVVVEKYLCGKNLAKLDGKTVTGLTDSAVLTNHVWKQIGVTRNDLTGRKLQPMDMQYLVLKSQGDVFYWVVACFGNGEGLKKGTGYAVAEYNDPVNKHKFVATYEMYKPVAKKVLCLKPTADLSGAQKEKGYVFLPDVATLEKDYDGAIEMMREAGWVVE